MTINKLLRNKKVKKQIIDLRNETVKEIHYTLKNLASEENIVKNDIDKYYYYFRCLNALKLSILIKRKEIIEKFLNRMLATMQMDIEKMEDDIMKNKYSKISVSNLEKEGYKDAIKIMIDSLSLLYMDNLINNKSLWKR